MEMVNQYDVVENQTLPVLVLTQDGINLAAFWARIITGHGIDKQFNPIYVMENIIPIFDSSYNYLIIEESKWNYSKSIVAFYEPHLNQIVIRSDVYEKSLEGDIFSQSIITHELVHYFQTLLLKFLTTFQCLDYSIEFCKQDSIEMQHQETQTDSISFLMINSNELFEGKTDEEIVDFYIIKPVIKVIDILLNTAGKEMLKEIKSLPLYQKLIIQKEEVCAV